MIMTAVMMIMMLITMVVVTIVMVMILMTTMTEFGDRAEPFLLPVEGLEQSPRVDKDFPVLDAASRHTHVFDITFN